MWVYVNEHMVDIEYRPIQKIIVHEIIKNTYDEFLDIFAVPQPPNAPPVSARWIDGVLFMFRGYPPSQEILQDNIQGTIHWEIVNFTEKEDFATPLMNPRTNATLQVVDNATNTAVSDFIRWLKRQPQWFPSS